MKIPPSTKARQHDGLRAIRTSTAQYVIGLDEVGIGSWAGPFAVAAVVAKASWQPSREFVRDSKKISYKKRALLVKQYLQPPEIEDCWIIKVEPEEFPTRGMLAVMLTSAMERAASYALASYPDSIVVADGDSVPKFPGTQSVHFPKADDLVPAVSAASIIAKVYRDELMERYAEVYPGYSFELNKGYGTEEHQDALERLGVCPIHRVAYRPIQEALERTKISSFPSKKVDLQGWPPKVSDLVPVAK